jgi:hypothetical protein
VKKDTTNSIFGQLLLADRKVEGELVEKRQALLQHWAKNHWNWLAGHDLWDEEVDEDRWGKDPETGLYLGRPLLWTTDGMDEENPIKPFPKKEYLKLTADVLMDPAKRFVLIDKSRQMFLSHLYLLLMDYVGKFRPYQKMLLSRTKEDGAIELMNDKIRATHKRLPAWVQEALPHLKSPANRIDYATGSSLLGVAQNVANSEARGNTAAIVAVDEACYQDMLGEIIAAARPMARRIWLVSTPYLGGPGGVVFKKIKDEQQRRDR